LRFVLILREPRDGQERKQDSEDDPNINAHQSIPAAGSHPRRYAESNWDRGKSRDFAPPTPPDIRVRVRRFSELCDTRGCDGSQGTRLSGLLHHVCEVVQ
jgi:hypothetical protein